MTDPVDEFMQLAGELLINHQVKAFNESSDSRKCELLLHWHLRYLTKMRNVANDIAKTMSEAPEHSVPDNVHITLIHSVAEILGTYEAEIMINTKIAKVLFPDDETIKDL